MRFVTLRSEERAKLSKAAGVFLELNGLQLQAPEHEAVTVIVALSDRTLDASGFAAWLKAHSAKVR